jgi:subtilisin family serine protease
MKPSIKLHHFALAVFTAATCVSASTTFAQAGNSPVNHPFAQSRPVPGRYIVVFKSGVGNPAAETANVMRGLGGQLHHVYANSLKGFAATLPDAALAGIRNNPNVAYIEQDQTVSLNQTSPENQATWGLDRIDQVDLPLNSQYYFNTTGAGVNAFIIDTGIRADHIEFTGRVLPGITEVADGNGTNDCNGHGTHVSGTVGGTTYGVAKGVTLIPVRVLDCAGSGTWSGVIAGIDWVAGSTSRPAVANMSLGGGKSTTLNAAVAGAVGKGVTMLVAAGNSNANACNSSPSSEPSAITVGATDNKDVRASYSNYGSCVDIFAPGSGITSSWNSSTTATNTISGTSMASPHVTGVAALALAANTTASPAAVAAFLTSHASLNKLSSIGSGSPNLLVFSLATGNLTESIQQTVAVKSLAGTSVNSGKRYWRATATVTIGDSNNSYAPVPNATVSGSFSPGGTASCVTTSTGSCNMTSANISTNTSISKMTFTNVPGTNLTYDSGSNVPT